MKSNLSGDIIKVLNTKENLSVLIYFLNGMWSELNEKLHANVAA